ncbi:unnamed protein product [Urochloa decumbens]|uniref:Saccharopine dehydrogenase NADP binding domain-containing protein n=1 Tax=Urochloa decumbens TaxID=240449 RepID=A0ABC9BAI5_9POAL
MCVVRACAPPAAAVATAPPADAGKRKLSRSARVLVLGGAGRVGGSTATALSKLRPDLNILVGDRNRYGTHYPVPTLIPPHLKSEPTECPYRFILKQCCLSVAHFTRDKGESFAAKLGEKSGFVQVDTGNLSMLENALQGVDLVVHTAGPFQRAEECTVLQAAISTKTAYVDVCDDMDYSWRAKGFHEEAKTAGVPAITIAGIYPGVSNGSGGAGPTILTTSFMLLGEDVIAYNKGEEIKLKPYSGALNIDFGKGVRKKNVYLLNLPEVKSAFKILGVPTVSARFGTAPFFWNWGMQAFASFLPVEFLRDKNKVQKLVKSVDPLVRAIDGIAGERVSMRVDLDCSNGRNTIGLFTHKKLAVSVGFATAAFALAVLEGNTQPGVWFPEEDILRGKSKVLNIDGIAGESVSMRVDLEFSNGQNTLGLFTHRRLSISVGYAATAFALAILEGNTQPGVWFPEEPQGIATKARKLLLQRATQGATNFVINKTSWMVETGQN